MNLALLGGRAGGKTTTIALDQLRFGELYGERAKSLLVRQTFAGLRDFEDCTRTLFSAAYGSAARFSQNDHTWRLPTGAYFELSVLESKGDLAKFIGRSFGTIYLDEITQHADPSLPDLLTANLRADKCVTTRLVVAGNPGFAGQVWVYKRWIAGHEPWKPWRDDFGAWWVYCPSTLADNPHVNQEAYERTLRASCQHDPELLRALLSGDFTSQTGAYFGFVFDEKRNVIDAVAEVPRTHGERWPTWCALDYGSAAPSVCYLLAESPGGKIGEQYFARGSIVALDEYAVCRKDNLNAGLHWTAATLGEALVEWLKGWDVPPAGVCDDACFSRQGHSGGSIAEELARVGLRLQPAMKADRVSGWTKMKRLLADAGSVDRPGLYLSRTCSYALQTLPFLSRDQRRPEDCSSDSFDHGADALRYGILRQNWATRIDIPMFHPPRGYGELRH
jgi:hypothetical protein